MMKLIGILLFFSFSTMHAVFEKPFVVIVPSYNNEKYYQENLDSICCQRYSNYRVIYINDCSSDKTGQCVRDYIEKRSAQNRVTLIDNTERKLAMRNIYEAVHSCKDYEIVVMVDGDDALKHDRVLEFLNELYQKDILLTYGNFEYLSNGKSADWVLPFPAEIIKKNQFRDKLFFTGMGHLRTFYAGLFKKINIDDLKFEGEFLKSAYDAAILYPMIEMAAHRHKCIDKVLYVYNDLNIINDHKTDPTLQQRMNEYIHSKNKYTYLKDVSWKDSINFDSIRTISFDESMQVNQRYDAEYAKKCNRWQLIKKLYQKNVTNAPKSDEGLPRIPKILHWIWLGSAMPERYKEFQRSFQKNHPKWEFRIWTDADVEPFCLKNKKAFDATYNWGEKSDIWRYEILERFGGVYVDTDFECLKPLDILHEKFDFYASVQYDSEARLYNGIIGSKPHHPIIKKCVENIKPVSGMQYWLDIMERTGPFYFTEMFFQALSEESQDSSVVLPLTFFFPVSDVDAHKVYPVNNKTVRNFFRPESFTVHYWDGSWVNALNIDKRVIG